MSISAFIETLRELDELKAQLPGIPIRLTGVGFYMPVLTAEEWMLSFGARGSVASPGGKAPDAPSSGCEGRSRGI